jgi:hypothetical protein
VAFVVVASFCVLSLFVATVASGMLEAAQLVLLERAEEEALRHGAAAEARAHANSLALLRDYFDSIDDDGSGDISFEEASAIRKLGKVSQKRQKDSL